MFTGKQMIVVLLLWMSGYGITSPGLLPMAIAAQTTQATTHEQTNDTPKPGFLLKTPDQPTPILAPLLKTDVKMTVSGLIVRTTVTQQFSNPTSEWTEGVYVFPLPDDAAVDHLRMRIGDRIIEGQILERTEAKKTYEKAKANGQQTSLLEQERPNIFTTSVANIAPHAAMTVDIEYQAMVRYDQGRFSLRFPTVVGPRYIPGHTRPQEHISASTQGLGWASNTDEVPDASRITPPVQHPVHDPLNPITLHIDLAPGFRAQSVESPTHPIHITKQENQTYDISFQDSQVYADRDFELIWAPMEEDDLQTTLFSETIDDETYYFLQLMPPVTSTMIEFTVSREVIFVLDTSGSMQGQSIRQAKAALQLALTRLTSKDSFNLIQFNSTTQSLFPTPQNATSQHIHQARQYLQHLRANGGTEMKPALDLAMGQPMSHNENSALRQIIFITDGLVGNEDTLFRQIQRDLKDQRLFTVGIGLAPNGHFMRKAAQFGKGTFIHISSTTDVQDKMSRLFHKLEQPAVTNIALEAQDFDLVDLTPNPVPDLYVGEPLTLAFRSNHAPASITLYGQRGSVSWDTTVSLSDHHTRDGIAIHWARQRISRLTDQHNQTNDTTELRQQVLSLALKHHLVSRYTSLVAVDVTPLRLKEQQLHTHALKTNLPHGMQYGAIFGWPQTATPASLYLILGTLTVGLVWLCWRYHLALR